MVLGAIFKSFPNIIPRVSHRLKRSKDLGTMLKFPIFCKCALFFCCSYVLLHCSFCELQWNSPNKPSLLAVSLVSIAIILPCNQSGLQLAYSVWGLTHWLADYTFQQVESFPNLQIHHVVFPVLDWLVSNYSLMVTNKRTRRGWGE